MFYLNYSGGKSNNNFHTGINTVILQQYLAARKQSVAVKLLLHALNLHSIILFCTI
jgi:hypothetical protein